MLGVSLQRVPPGLVELKGTVWLSGTVTTVVEKGKLTPPSVERANITLLGELIGLGPPQHMPLCQAYPMVPLGEIPIEGNSLWFWLSENSLVGTRARVWAPGGFQVTPLSEDQRIVTVLYEPDPPESNRASVT